MTWNRRECGHPRGWILAVGTFFVSSLASAGMVVAPEALAPLARKLARPGAVVRVLHLGDSHVQGASFPGGLRELFQSQYGNAGRGLVFSHRAALTNGAHDQVWTANGPLVVSNALRRENPMPWGLAGWSAAGLDSGRVLMVRAREEAPAGVLRTRRAWVLGQGVSLVSADSCDSLRPTVRRCRADLGDSLVVRLDSFPARFDGLVLENGQPGVVWSESGVNGLSWTELTRPSRMWEQIGAWEPDLILVSLGTNDAFAKGYDSDNFREVVAQAIGNLRAAAPGAVIAVTLPPDHALKVRRRRFGDNPRIASVESVLRATCSRLGVAGVELRALQGGEGAWKAWAARGLLGKDHIHYTAAGYREQARLIHGALAEVLARPADSAAASLAPDSEASHRRDGFLAAQDSLLARATWAEPKSVKPKPPRKAPRRFHRFSHFRRPR